ncbi:transposable element Tcb2 transposase [Trichonephila clavipes]|nr:transposable element Tcb2 transposase [Trichonephila clavipes]
MAYSGVYRTLSNSVSFKDLRTNMSQTVGSHLDNNSTPNLRSRLSTCISHRKADINLRHIYKYFNLATQTGRGSLVVKENATKLGLESSFSFKHGNDPKHTAKIVKLWLLHNVVNQLHTPSRSPDLNPIEHLRDLLKRRIHQHNVSSKDMLKSVLKDEWEKIIAEETTILVNSMPKRLQEFLKRRSYPTSY